jgi:toxin ParE1/3/4
VTAALSLVQELREKCFALADAPRGYPLVPRYEHHGIRRRPFGSYLIFYRVGTEAIEVVLHRAPTMSRCCFRENEARELQHPDQDLIFERKVFSKSKWCPGKDSNLHGR